MNETVVRPNLPYKPASFLIYGDTDAGKTKQTGFWATWLFKKTGGKLVNKKPVGGLRTRLYACDSARWATIQPEIDLGIIEVVNCLEYNFPTIWAPRIASGEKIIDLPNGKKGWGTGDLSQIGCIVFDGLTGISDAYMADMRKAAEKGISIGGDAAMKYTVKDEITGQDVTSGMNNLGHFRVAQDNIRGFVGIANRLVDKGNYVIYTATQRRGEEDTRQVISGPEVAGKALTSELPRLVTYTFQLVAIPKEPRPEHQLYVESHLDRSAGGAKAMGNARVGMASPDSVIKDFKTMISPADMVKAYEQIMRAQQQSEDELVKELS